MPRGWRPGASSWRRAAVGAATRAMHQLRTCARHLSSIHSPPNTPETPQCVYPHRRHADIATTWGAAQRSGCSAAWAGTRPVHMAFVRLRRQWRGACHCATRASYSMPRRCRATSAHATPALLSLWVVGRRVCSVGAPSAGAIAKRHRASRRSPCAAHRRTVAALSCSVVAMWRGAARIAVVCSVSAPSIGRAHSPSAAAPDDFHWLAESSCKSVVLVGNGFAASGARDSVCKNRASWCSCIVVNGGCWWWVVGGGGGGGGDGVGRCMGGGANGGGGGGAWLGLRRLVEWNGKKGCGVRAWWVRGGGVAHSKQPRAPSRRIFARKGRTAGPKRRRPVPPDGTGTTAQQPRNASRRTITMVEATLRSSRRVLFEGVRSSC